MLELSFIVVTSPSPSNPSTTLIDAAIDSFSMVAGTELCPIIIVLDGYKLSTENRTKKGRITEKSAELYKLYYQSLCDKYAGSRYIISRCDNHEGFAHSVRHGLELCETSYAIIAQHDRIFDSQFFRINDLIQAMEEDASIRYIGFPTSTNINHDKIISTTYGLYCLNKPNIKLHLGNNLYLQPLIFWFDSQHLCHVKRYLQIYKPYKNLPLHLREKIGMRSIRDMLLRPGDFIEDRFGQIQRKLLSQLIDKKGRQLGNDIDDYGNDVVELFKWYGSYLCWQNSSDCPYDVHCAQSRNDTVVMVRHLRGRQTDLDELTGKLLNSLHSL